MKSFYDRKNIKGKIGINYFLEDDDSVTTAVDVYGRFCSPTVFAEHYLIECKGTSSDNKLVLVEQTDKFYRNKHASYHYVSIDQKNKKLIPNDCNFLIDNKKGPFIVFTGDFFVKKSNGDYKKANIHNDRNLLFKGIKQLVNSSNILLKNTELVINDLDNILTSLIVTNADIFTVNYEKKLLRKVPWVVYQRGIMDENHNESALGYMPYIHIVSLQYLSDFLEFGKRDYKKDWDFEEESIT